ncbi:MAG: hypothetical protein ACON5F_09340 [Jejuia sp.]
MAKNNFIAYTATIIIATFLTFFFHEMCNWMAYELMGYDAGFTLNTAGVKNSEIELSKVQKIITSGSGPLFTILQAIVFYFLLKRRNNIMLYPFLFLPFVMRLGAGIANVFQPNDEGRISLYLGLNLYTISAIVVSFLFVLVYKTSKREQYGIKTNTFTFIMTLLLMLIVSYVDGKYKIRFI